MERNSNHTKSNTLLWQALGVSAFLHILLLLALTLAPLSLHQKTISTTKTTPKPITSYLYQQPKKIASVIPSTNKQTNNIPKKIKPIKQTTNKVSPIKVAPTQQTLPKVTTNNATALTKKPLMQKPSHSPNTNTHKPQTQYSTWQKLQNLRKKLDEQNITQDIADKLAPRSHSAMHKTPASVPHSKKQLSKDENKINNTTSYSDDISIIKGDDGMCTKLQKVALSGSQSITTTQYFSCGETKLSKQFRQHMEKVRQKIGK